MVRKITIELIKQELLETHPGSKLISTEYINNQSKLNLICENNHNFNISWNSIQQGGWCGECFREKGINLNDVKIVLKKFHPKAKLLSTEYINYKSKLNFICAKNHLCTVSFSHLKRGQLCAICSKRAKKTIKDIEDFLSVKYPKAKLLSKEYINAQSQLEIICEKGHYYKTSWNRIQSGKWCLDCTGNKKKTIEDVKNIIDKLHPEAKLLSIKYEGTHKKLDLICENNHEFKMSISCIERGKWCSECAGNKKKTIEDVKNIIDKLHPEAKLLSIKYEGTHKKLDLICEKGHNFKISYSYINSNHWCPTCAGNKGEELVRRVFEDKFKKSFPNVKPKWLINPKTNYTLQLDGFCEELNLAFEYQGIQHYKYPNHCHKNKKEFEKQKYRDKIKKDLCKKHNVKLIEIKEIDDLTYENVNLVVSSFLKESNIIV